MKSALVTWAEAQEDVLDAYFDRWWAMAESYRWLRIKGGIDVVNAGRIG